MIAICTKPTAVLPRRTLDEFRRTDYVDDGRLEIDNNAAERALRGVSLGRKNYLFMGRSKSTRLNSSH